MSSELYKTADGEDCYQKMWYASTNAAKLGKYLSH